MPRPAPDAPRCPDDPLPAKLMDAYAALLRNAPKYGRQLVEDIYRDPVLFPLQRQREAIAAIEHVRRLNPRVICEIGADKGGNILHWISALPTLQRVAIIEIRGVPYADLLRQHYPYLDILAIPDGSYDDSTVATVKKWLGNDRFDSVFIDGDKGAFDVDFECYSPLIRKGGVAMLHDIHEAGDTGMTPPRQVFLGLEFLYPTSRIVDVSEALDARVRQSMNVAASCEHENWLRTWGPTSCGYGIVHL